MKPWYTSKTLWVNAIATVGMIAQGQFGHPLSPEVQLEILGGVNIILRLITKTAVVWK